ncbi:COP9 signalosome complex subunit 7, partial [Tremellales sp. Uapishka_1]
MADLAARLEPFVLLARSTKGVAAAKVVMDATAAPGVYVFSELLELPNIQELQTNPEYSKHYDLLRLFAYGTMGEYHANTDQFPPLSPAHHIKLKHLTLVSLALENRSLPYDLLLAVLDLETIRQLEDLIIDVIYSDLLGGKMHHHEKIFHVDWVAGRDLREADLAQVKAGLQNWCQTAESLLRSLDHSINDLRSAALIEKEHTTAFHHRRDELYLRAAAEVGMASSAGLAGKRSGGNGPGGRGMGDGDLLEGGRRSGRKWHGNKS